ncbi:hypothetical protein WL08_29490 [Burkholderia ubonensis]|nr:hypothetical protein WL08_29490 [Burkholderia ubonensis]
MLQLLIEASFDMRVKTHSKLPLQRATQLTTTRKFYFSCPCDIEPHTRIQHALGTFKKFI